MTVRKGYGFGPEAEDDPALLPQEYVEQGNLVGAEPMTDTASPVDAADPVQVDSLPVSKHVPPEYRLATSLGASDALRNAARTDRRRQNSDDLRMLLLAASRREQPNLRNLGTPELQAVLQGMRGQPKPVDPMESEKRLLELQKLRQGMQPKGEDPLDYLTPAEQASAEEQMTMAAGMPSKLPRDEKGRTRKTFFNPSLSSAGMMGMGEQKAAISAAGREAQRITEQEAALLGPTIGRQASELTGAGRYVVPALKPRAPRAGATPEAVAAKEESAAAYALPAEWESKTASKEQRQQFAGVVTKAGKAKAITARMRSLLAEAGAARVVPGWLKSEKAKALTSRIASEAAKLDIEVKNVAELGALSGPDMGLVRRVISDPNSALSLGQDVAAQLDAVDAWGADAVSETAMGSNINRRGRASLTPGGKPYTKKVYSPSRKRTYWLDESGAGIEEADGQR